MGTSMISESYYNGIRRNTFFGEYPIEVANYTQMQDESEQNETASDENKQKLELLEEEKPDPNQDKWHRKYIYILLLKQLNEIKWKLKKEKRKCK